MTQETYRFAYDEANAELREIVVEFEQLRARKEQIEQVIEALRAVLAEEPVPETGMSGQREPTPFLVQCSTEATAEPHAESEAEPVASESDDPFQRRIDLALRHGLGSRESRILPRTLTGLLSRM